MEKIMQKNISIFLEIWCDTPILHHGQKIPGTTHSTYPHRAKISLKCLEGHVPRGDMEIECQANGRWTRPEGACHSEYKVYLFLSHLHKELTDEGNRDFQPK